MRYFLSKPYDELLQFNRSYNARFINPSLPITYMEFEDHFDGVRICL
jgi:hypothetical protein